MSISLKLELVYILAKNTDAAPEIRSGISSLIKKCDEIARQADCPHQSTKTETGSCHYGEYKTETCKACGKTLKYEKSW
jgi:hypothetical protein